ncbi:MAG: GAF domain-containing protein [Anaerolineae bacterium]|nr:GAF domain-containing protein [Anaerolineae bacterium]
MKRGVRFDLEMTLKRKVLTLYVAVTVMILAVVGGLLFARFRHDRLEDLERELLNQLKHIDFALTNFMAEADSNVAALAANEMVRTRQDQEFTSFLEADPETWVYNPSELEQGIVDLFNTFRLTHPYMNSIYMGRENGSFVRSHPRAEPTRYDPRTRPWYVLARDNPGKVMYTEPYRSVTTPDVNIGVVTALVDDTGVVYGVVGADITLASLNRYLSGFEVGHGGQILLLDQSGTILVGKDEASSFQLAAPLAGDEAGALLEGENGVVPYDTTSRRSYLFFYTSPQLGWKLAIVIPRGAIQREIMSAVLPALAGLLAALLLLSGLTFAGLNRAVLRPLVHVHDVTLDVARTGDLDLRAEVMAQDEIGALAASLNLMMLNLRDVQQDLRRERDLAQALKDAATTMTTTLEFEIVLDRILEQVSRVVPNEACNVMLIQEDRVRAVRWLGYERLGGEDYIAHAEFSLSETPTFRQMVSSKKPLLVPVVEAYPGWQGNPDLAWLRSYAATPIIMRDRAIGFLSVDSSVPNFFQDHHLEVLRTFAGHASVAIENARLYEQIRHDAVELEARIASATQELAQLYQKSEQHAVELGILYEIGKEITATLALDAMLQTIVDNAVRLVGADKSLLALIDVAKERLGEIVGHGYSRAQLDAHTFGELRDGLTGWVLREKVATLTDDLQNDERQHGAALVSARRSGDRSVAVAPLLLGDQVLGTLTVVNGPARPAFTPADLNLVTMLASQAAVAIQKAQLYEAAQEADRLKSAFLASMSHELRTPLNSIIGFTGILLQGLVGPLNGEQQKQLGMVMHSARHLLALINDVLDISKIEAGELQLASERFDACQAVQHAVQTVTPIANKKGLALIVEVSPEVGRIVGDRRRLEQVLINLINNALKFTNKGEVRIRSHVANGKLVTQVTDTGIGIRPEDLPKLFKPFRQLETGVARRHEGTGLGLAICDRLVTLMGGTIGVESRWGEGSTFTFALPTGEDNEAQDSRHRGQ